MSADAARKADTYRKIMLGGLVIKGGCGDLAPALLLGLLADAEARSRAAEGDKEHEWHSTAARLIALGDPKFGNTRR
jgi:hypothetical protein